MKSTNLKRPSTHVLSTRVDVRSLATLFRYWSSKNVRPRSLSETIKLSLESYCDLLVNHGLVEEVTDSLKAHEFLVSIGLIKGRQKELNQKTLHQQISREALQNDGSFPTYGETVTTKENAKALEALQKKLKPAVVKSDPANGGLNIFQSEMEGLKHGQKK